MNHCLNCGTGLRGEYCYKCGQRVESKRITAKYLLEEILHFFTHFEHGFVYTSRELLLRPGRTFHLYLNGKRKRFQQPISYIVIWIAIEWIIRNQIVRQFHYGSLASFNQTPDYTEMKLFYDNYSSLFVFILVPVLAFIYYLILGRPRYNFYEMVVINLYGYGTYFILQLIFSTLLLGLFFRVNIKNFQVGLWTSIIAVIWGLWATYDFFKKDHIRLFHIKIIAAVFIGQAISSGIILFFPISWMHFIEQYI